MAMSGCQDWLPASVQEYMRLYKDFELYTELCANGPKVLSIAVASYLTYKAGHQFFTSRRLRKRRKEVQTKLKEKKQDWLSRALSQIDAAESERITSMPFNNLVTLLQKGELKAVTVLRAFQRKAAVEDQKYNFVTEPMNPIQAEQLAQELDGLSASERKSKPLFGIPLSVKENEEIAGEMLCNGLSSELDVISENDSPRVKVLRDMGAVPFIRTNVPQALLSFSCVNPVYGETRNPHDETREPGGSSGGESAAIACGASVFGLGSDIGGSVRIPAAWCGHPAFKPTAGRLSGRGRMAANPGQTVVNSTAGPMASTVEGLILMTRAFSSPDMFQADPTIPHIPMNETELNETRSLTIGMFEDCPDVEVCEAAKRAVRQTVKLLTAKGHKVVPYTLRDIRKITSTYMPRAVFADSGKALCDTMYGDEITLDNTPMYNLLRLPYPIKYILNRLLRLVMPTYIAAVVKSNMGVSSVRDWFLFTKEVEDFRYQVIDDWRAEGLDALICPAMPIPAMHRGKTAYAKAAIWYMTPYNVLNFPAGVVPITKVTAADLKIDKTGFPPKDIFHKAMKQSLEGSEGLPMAVQVVTLPNHDEMCLRLMKEVEADAKFSGFRPYNNNNNNRVYG